MFYLKKIIFFKILKLNFNEKFKMTDSHVEICCLKNIL